MPVDANATILLVKRGLRLVESDFDPDFADASILMSPLLSEES